MKVRYSENRAEAAYEDGSRGLTGRKVCETLGISRETWDKWRARLPNGQLRTDLEDLEAWMEALDAA